MVFRFTQTRPLDLAAAISLEVGGGVLAAVVEGLVAAGAAAVVAGLAGDGAVAGVVVLAAGVVVDAGAVVDAAAASALAFFFLDVLVVVDVWADVPVAGVVVWAIRRLAESRELRASMCRAFI